MINFALKTRDFVLKMMDFVLKMMILLYKQSELREKDQLLDAIKKGDAFSGFVDAGDLNFMPTYKYDKGTREYDTSEKQRVPAWPDRILMRTKDDVRLVAAKAAAGLASEEAKLGGEVDERYMAHEDILMSDHRPISADLEVGVLVADEAKRDVIMWDCLKQLDELENQTVPKLLFSQTLVDISSRPMSYAEPTSQFVFLRNEGELPSTFRFVAGNEQMHPPLRAGETTGLCASWLSVAPISGVLMPGEVVQLTLTGCVNKAEAMGVHGVIKASGGADDERPGKLEDILVVGFSGMTSSMSANAFLQVVAAYKGSPWGLSLEELLEQEEKEKETSSLTPKSHFVPRVMRAILQYLESAAKMVPEGSGADWGEEESAVDEHWAAVFSLPSPGGEASLSAEQRVGMLALRELLSDQATKSISEWAASWVEENIPPKEDEGLANLGTPVAAAVVAAEDEAAKAVQAQQARLQKLPASTDRAGAPQARSSPASIGGLMPSTPSMDAADSAVDRPAVPEDLFGGGVGAVVASATVVASEVLVDFLDSLEEPAIPAAQKLAALRAASAADTDALLSLPTELPRAHAGVFSELVAVASSVLQSLEVAHATLPSPLSSPRASSEGAAAPGSGSVLATIYTPPNLELREAQLHLLKRMAVLLLRPTIRELEAARKFVAFFLFGQTGPACLLPVPEAPLPPPFPGDGSVAGGGESMTPRGLASLPTPSRFRRNSAHEKVSGHQFDTRFA